MAHPRPPIIWFGEIDSTNQEVRRRIDAGNAELTWIVADRQTAGRGRRGRQWVSPSGNLMASLCLPLSLPSQAAAQLSFVTSLAVHDVVAHYISEHSVAVKWPNDVLIEGQKVAGILLEVGRVVDNMVASLVIGIGINLAFHPEDTPYPATHVGAWTAVIPDRNEVLARLVDAFKVYFDVFSARGFDPIRRAWLDHATGVGTLIEVKMESQTLIGVFEDLNSDGQLCLRTKDGALHLVAAGDVFFPGLGHG